MKQTIILKSRYGDSHRLDRIGQEDSCLYLFVPEGGTYRMGLHGDADSKEYDFVDPSGGPFIAVGKYLPEADKTVKSIKQNPHGCIEIEFE